MAEGEPKPRLSDLAAEVFAFAFQLKASKDPGKAADVKQSVVRLFSEFETAARSGGYKAENISSAKYALTAFIDELVLAGSAPMKDEWAGSPLQLELFNDFAAGEEFYTKLKTVRASGDAESREVAGVFFLALTHGFKGMYIDLRGMEERKTLMDALSAEMKQGAPGDPKALSPSWKAPDDIPKLVKSAPVWVMPVVCGVVLILMVLALAFAANLMADSAIGTLIGS
ncbi:MAG: DotU family type IV/VI secretion system protein [Planctomycetes bacterium]|nr:DotU family type IV/VI secretion system protein [Planctomycetota bacterium]